MGYTNIFQTMRKSSPKAENLFLYPCLADPEMHLTSPEGSGSSWSCSSASASPVSSAAVLRFQGIVAAIDRQEGSHHRNPAPNGESRQFFFTRNSPQTDTGRRIFIFSIKKSYFHCDLFDFYIKSMILTCFFIFPEIYCSSKSKVLLSKTERQEKGVTGYGNETV